MSGNPNPVEEIAGIDTGDDVVKAETFQKEEP